MKLSQWPSVPPREARLDVGGPCTDGGDPLPHRRGDELRAAVRPDVIGNTAQDEQIGPGVDDVGRPKLPVDPDRQAFPCDRVDQVEHAERPSVVGAGFDDVVGADMVRALRPQTDAGPVVEPEPTLLRLFCRHLEPLPPPDALDPLHVHRPTGFTLKGCDAPIA